MRYLYSALLYALLPFILLRLLWRSRRAPDYRRRLGQRFGRFDFSAEPARPVIWVHAVSVGEVTAAAPLIKNLLLSQPGYQLVLTTTTPTGSQRGRELFADRVVHLYAPWDLPMAVRAFLRRTRPSLLLLMETELWPNLLHHSQVAGCRVMLANGRMSVRSARRYARFSDFTRDTLAQLDIAACQSSADGERLLELGLDPAALRISGNIKFDLLPDEAMREHAARLRSDWGLGQRQRPVVVAASTHPGEDELILEAFTQLRDSFGDCLLLLVPRHPERFSPVVELCTKAGWRVTRRSTGINPGQEQDIVIGDTMGELPLLLSLATVAVVGGSLVPRGGHNVLEAAAWGVPVVTGSSLYNFAAVSDSLLQAGAMIAVQQPAQLGDCLIQLLGDESRRLIMGAAGVAAVARGSGATDNLAQLVAEQLARA